MEYYVEDIPRPDFRALACRMDSTPSSSANPQPPAEAPPRFPGILYAVGPGDAAGYFRLRRDGLEPPFQMSMAFSEQFFRACSPGRRLWLLSSHPRRERLRLGPHRIENLPRSPLYFRRGILHHLGLLHDALRLISRALVSRASLVVADSGTTHWIFLSPLRLFGIPVIAVFHNTLWPAGFPPRRRLDRLLRAADGWFFRHVASASVGVSPECARQIRSLARPPRGPVYQCRAQYPAGFLADVPPPDHASRPFRILFLGRLEDFKGVHLLLDAAARLERLHPGGFAWKIVGSGPAASALDARIRGESLDAVVALPGTLPSAEAARQALAWAHLVVVPTTSAFPEGLAMTAAEAALAGRPSLVSSVVPAAEVLGPAALVFPADDLEAFCAALGRLAFDPDAYAEACRATRAARHQFFDRSLGLGAVLKRAIDAL